MKTFWAFLLLIGFLLVACLITGCAQMGTRQLDQNETTRYELDTTGKTNAITKEVRTTSTKAKGTAVITGNTALKGFRAKQDGGIQGLEIKETSQKTDGLKEAVETLRLLKDLAGMAYGIPPAPSASQPPQATPPGMKWILAPKDTPSQPKPEIE